MRIGLAGLGRIGMVHGDTLRAIDAVDSLVVADADPARVRAQADRLGAQAVDSPEALIAAGLDGLVIAATTAAHAELIIAGVRAGLPVFCEKPVAGDAESTLAVVREVAGAPVQIGFQRRFDAGFAAARAAVAAGRLGWVHTVRAATLDPAPPPAAYLANSGGFFRDCGVHDFDAIRWVTGREVTEVYAAGANHGAELFREHGDVDAVAALLTLDDGAFALVSGTRYNAAGYDVRLEVLGSLQGIAAGLDDGLPLRSTEPGVTFPAGPPYRQFTDRFRAAYIAEIRDFVDLVAGRGTVTCSVHEALAAFYVAEACERSRRERRAVRLDEVRR
ncbi:MAG: dehydrogenase [Pseudonocardiales bacterium]|nr:MAG: dehydrogenase [Pseudonocardiales bacterium]